MSSEKEQLTLALTDMAHRGEALARHDGQVVFAAYGIPGEDVRVEVQRRKRAYLQGSVIDVVTASPHRVEPACPYFGTCSGCSWQHIDYGFQLELKQRVVGEQMRRIAKNDEAIVLPALPSKNPLGYRNHARFTVNRDGKLGFVQRASHRFVPIDECLIMHPWINDALNQLQGKCAETRQVALRYSSSTGSWLIHPKLSVDDVELESGQPFYEEELRGHRFRVSGASFFQVNIAQADVLATVVHDRLKLSGSEVLLDAYAGVGTFGVLFASECAQVIAVEESSAAIKDAEVNSSGITNLHLVKGKTENVLDELEERPDVVILDPSRAGCHRRVVDSLLRVRPQRIVYVSCDPATLARDLALFCDGGYGLEELQPVDMFPQTYHIECVASLELT
jgi:23S rRNA (uracil1939-C5)-methyltransferase